MDPISIRVKKSKCIDFAMYHLATQHTSLTCWIVGNYFGCMYILVSTGLIELVVSYCYLFIVMFHNFVIFVMKENIKWYTSKFCCETKQI